MASTFPVLRMVLNNTNVEFRDSDIISCNVVQETHPISMEIPASTAEVLIFTQDPRFSIFSSGEFYSALAQNVPADLYESVDGVECLVGHFYLDTWESPTEYQIRFSFVDAVGVYDKLDYLGSFWEQPATLEEVLRHILAPVGLPYEIAAKVKNRTVMGWIPPGTVREALMQACFATGVLCSTAHRLGAMFTDSGLPTGEAELPYGLYGQVKYGDGTFYNRIALQTPITDADKTDKQNVKHLPLVTGITLISHNYYHPEAGAQQAETIADGWYEAGDHAIPYKKPYWLVWADGVGAFPIYIATEDGRVIVTEGSGDTWQTAIVATESETFEFYSNHVQIHVQTAGNVKIMGYPWLENLRKFTYDEAEASQVTTLAATPNVKSVEKATLVGVENAEAVLSRLVEYHKLRYQQNIRLFVNPTVNLGDIQEVDSLNSKKIIGIVKKMSSDLSGGCLIDAEIVGLEKVGV